MPGSARNRPDDGRSRADLLDHRIARLAAERHGVLAMRELVALGLSASAVRSRVAGGRLHRLHSRAVSLVPPALLTRRGRIAGAVIACAPGTGASHRAASSLHELRLAARPWVDVTTPGRRGRRRPGIVVHDGLTLRARDLTQIDGIACTTLARTLLDVAEEATARELERALDRAAELRTLDMAALDDVLDHAAGRRGAARLRAVLAGHRVGSTPTRNVLEEKFLHIARATGHPPDAVNHWIAYPDGGGAEADFVWHTRRLVVEVDGRGTHATRRAFESDRRRDQRLTALGWRVVRFTWRQVDEEPGPVGETLRAVLAA